MKSLRLGIFSLLTVVGGIAASVIYVNKPQSFFIASDTYSCALPSGYSEIGDLVDEGLALASGNSKANTLRIRGTVTRVSYDEITIQRVNQIKGQLDSLLITGTSGSSFSEGEVVDFSGGTITNNDGCVSLSLGSSEVSFGTNPTGYGPIEYESLSGFNQAAFSRGNRSYSRLVKVEGVKVKYYIDQEVASASSKVGTVILTDEDDNEARVELYGNSLSSTQAILSSLNDYYLRGSTLDIIGVLSKREGRNYLRIVKSSDISLSSSNLVNPQETTILHAWNWSMNNIRNELDNIKNAGYKTIQISPLQPQKDYYSGASWSDQWWKLYQPLGFKVSDSSGENVLGTKSQLAALTSAAKERGISVIVDVVANHLANNGGDDNNFILSPAVNNYEPTIYSNPGTYTHTIFNGSSLGYGNYRVDDSDATKVVHGCMGMPDLTTDNSYVQDRVISMLKDYIDAGVYGFRFDAAKHIETPSDYYGLASNFWSNVRSQINSYAQSKYGFTPYAYGEILNTPGAGRSWDWYTPYISVTDAGEGTKVLGAVTGASTSDLSGYYETGLGASNLVIWAESHDTFANSDGATKNTDQTYIDKAYAIQAGRANAASLYLARPNSNTTFGSIGTTSYKSNLITGVNKFHNEFNGGGEYVYKDGSYYMNFRNTSEKCGVLIANIANVSYSSIDTKVDGQSKLDDGIYTNLVTGNKLTVTNGIVSSDFNNGIMALVNDAGVGVSAAEQSFETETSVTLSSRGNIAHSYYSINGGEEVEYEGNTVINVGDGLSNGNITISVRGIDNNGNEHTKQIVVTKGFSYSLYIDGNLSAAEFEDVSSYDKSGDNWVNQYKTTVSLTAGSTLSFSYGGTTISNISAGGDGNNLSDTFNIVASESSADIYLKKYSNDSYAVWVSGYVEPGYGIIIDGETKVRATDTGEEDSSGRTQYLIEDQSFTAGQTFSLYDFAYKSQWVIDIDSWSFNQSPDTYLSKGANAYTVLQSFVGDIYIKLKYEDDALYIGLKEEPIESSSEEVVSSSEIISSSSESESISSSSIDTSTKTLYFSSNKGWSSVYCYLWNSNGDNSWPGTLMTYISTNSYSEKQYSITFDSSYVNAIFTNNSGEQTIDIDISQISSGTGFYLTDKSNGKWGVGTFAYA